ncbi:glycoside hydrolase family 16 protein [Streptomyces sp. NRRL B-24484]|uniref:glycoside hydrolase family 16 protein n=1 Tax=Streptomyces sp. NRRL B-24484 TaxID=1463833 RepID=UPI000693FD37|nr:glycoside hydrolase family 16 protein [Streptomyces sp. NRRL B-24484]
MPRNSKHRRTVRLTARRAAALGLAVAAVGTGAAAWAAPGGSSDPVVVDSLAFTPAAPTAGAAVTATAKVHATQQTAVQALTVAVRSSSGANYDFAGAIPTTLTSTQQTFVPKSRTFPAGSYTMFVAYKANNVWHNLTPKKAFTSDGSTVTPTTPSAPATSASPTPTAAPSTSAPASTAPVAPSTSAPASTAPTASATPSTAAPSTAAPSASASATTAPSSGGPLGIAGSWRQVFADDFNGTSVDSGKWTANWLGCATCTTPPVNSYEKAAYAPSQATVSGGNLHLTATAKAATANGKSFPYTSGMVQSNGKAQFTFGAFEARIYLPGSGGKISNWPAFWTDGQSWPTDGEMDVMEGLGGQACYHYHSPSGGPGSCAPGDYTGWHTYGAEWAPGSVTYYYDGKKVGQITTGITSSPHYLILNNGVYTTDTVTADTDMQVDYVKVWQH